MRAGIERARREIQELEREYGLEVPLDARVADLPVGVQQRVEILKALFRGAHVLILDEPTGVLTPQEADHLFRILRNLKAQGRTVVLITHKLREIMAVTDKVSVMRRGEMVAHRRTAETSREELAELMVGRKVLLRVEKAPPARASRCLRSAISRSGRPGRRAGQGCELRGPRRRDRRHRRRRRQRPDRAPRRAGRHPPPVPRRDHGPRRPRRNPAQARVQKLAHVPEDRLRMGLVQGFPAWENAILGYQVSAEYAGGFLRRLRIIDLCRDWMAGYDVRPQEPTLEATSFSGGNQQKLVIARELEHDPDLLLVGQPTRGVDIGAIEFIHRRLVDMRDAGKAVLLVSVELDEILSLSDRILVMFDGRITGELKAAEADERKVGLLMAGVTRRRLEACRALTLGRAASAYAQERATHHSARPSRRSRRLVTLGKGGQVLPPCLDPGQALGWRRDASADG